MATTGPGPLHGIRILDLTTVVMGPLSTRALGDLGWIDDMERFVTGSVKERPPRPSRTHVTVMKRQRETVEARHAHHQWASDPSQVEVTVPPFRI